MGSLINMNPVAKNVCGEVVAIIPVHGEAILQYWGRLRGCGTEFQPSDPREMSVQSLIILALWLAKVGGRGGISLLLI